MPLALKNAVAGFAQLISANGRARRNLNAEGVYLK